MYQILANLATYIRVGIQKIDKDPYFNCPKTIGPLDILFNLPILRALFFFFLCSTTCCGLVLAMGHGKQLSEFERGRIAGLKSAGKGFREIGRSKDVVRTFLRDPASYGTHNQHGKPKSVTPRDERRIRRAFFNSQMSLRRAKSEFGLTASKSSVHRALKRNLNIKMQPAPRILKCHKDLRMQYAQKYMSWKNEWKQVWILMVVQLLFVY